MDEINRILAQLQDVAPAVVESARRQIWIDFGITLTVAVAFLVGTLYCWKRQRTSDWSQAEGWKFATIVCGLAAAVMGLFLLVSLGEVLNPDYAVYRRLLPD